MAMYEVCLSYVGVNVAESYFNQMALYEVLSLRFVSHR
jgi:hypothetical protein